MLGTRSARQAAQNPAVACILRHHALLAQPLELLLQPPQFPDPCGDVADVFIEQGVDIPAVLAGRVLEPQQHPDFVERHVE